MVTGFDRSKKPTFSVKAMQIAERSRQVQQYGSSDRAPAWAIFLARLSSSVQLIELPPGTVGGVCARRFGLARPAMRSVATCPCRALLFPIVGAMHRDQHCGTT
jgi:hypothetical protein